MSTKYTFKTHQDYAPSSAEQLFQSIHDEDSVYSKERKRNRQAAIEHLQVLALAGDYNAIQALALLQFEGRYMPRDKRKAKLAVSIPAMKGYVYPQSYETRSPVALKAMRDHKVSRIATKTAYDSMGTSNMLRYVALFSILALSNQETVPLLHTLAKNLSDSQLLAFKSHVANFVHSSGISFALAYGSIIVFSLMLIVELSVMAKSLIENRDKINNLKDFRREVGHLLNKNQRASRMINAGSWLSIALLGLAFPPAAPFIMAAGLCLIDTPNTIYHANQDRYLLKRQIIAIDSRIEDFCKKKNVNFDEINRIFKSVPAKEKQQQLNAAMQHLDTDDKVKLAALCESRIKLSAKHKKAKRDLIKLSVAASVVAIAFIAGISVPIIAPIGYMVMALTFAWMFKRKLVDLVSDDEKPEKKPSVKPRPKQKALGR